MVSDMLDRDFKIIIFEQPVDSPWSSADVYPALYGRTLISSVTFARFNNRPCAAIRDIAIAGFGWNFKSADSWSPISLSQLKFVMVDEDSRIYFPGPNPGWLNQADCIDMDCDGPKVHSVMKQ